MTSESSGQDQPEVMTIEQVAELLQLHVETVRKLAKSGAIPGRKIGGSYRFSRQRLLDWVGDGDPPSGAREQDSGESGDQP